MPQALPPGFLPSPLLLCVQAFLPWKLEPDEAPWRRRGPISSFMRARVAAAAISNLDSTLPGACLGSEEAFLTDSDGDEASLTEAEPTAGSGKVGSERVGLDDVVIGI
jgi:hypothetical protein